MHTAWVYAAVTVQSQHTMVCCERVAARDAVMLAACYEVTMLQQPYALCLRYLTSDSSVFVMIHDAFGILT